MVFQVEKTYQTLSITGNFEKGILTEGPVLFEYRGYSGDDRIVLEGTYSPANLTFQIQGHIRELGCKGTIFITNGKPISKTKAESKWMVELQPYAISSDSTMILQFDSLKMSGDIKVWNQLASFNIKHHDETNATVCFSNGNKYIGPVYRDMGYPPSWYIGKSGYKFSIGIYPRAVKSIFFQDSDLFNIKYFWNNGDSFEGAAIRGKGESGEDVILPVSGEVTYNNGIKDQNWKIPYQNDSKSSYSMDFRFLNCFTLDKNPSQSKKEAEKVAEKIRAEIHAKERARDSLILENKKRIEQRKQSLVRKYGQRYGSLIFQKKIKIGMTKEMCRDAIGEFIEGYFIETSVEFGHRVEKWTFNPFWWQEFTPK